MEHQRSSGQVVCNAHNADHAMPAARLATGSPILSFSFVMYQASVQVMSSAHPTQQPKKNVREKDLSHELPACEVCRINAAPQAAQSLEHQMGNCMCCALAKAWCKSTSCELAAQHVRTHLLSLSGAHQTGMSGTVLVP